METASTRATPIPIGTRLLHIGPSKTGTTSVQGACWVARHELRSQGVRYAGPARHSALAARAVAGLPPGHDEGAPMWAWRGIVREIRRAREPRVLYSSEHLAHATPPQAQAIVRDLDPSKVHVLVTVRPIARMLTSLWQQSVASGSGHPLDAWLEARLGRAGSLPDHPMWEHQRHDRLVRRWVDVVGRDRVSVLVVDSSDHGWLLRAVEDLLALRPGTLQVRAEYQNRSLTAPEVDVLRALNRNLRHAGVSRTVIAKVASQWISPYLETRVPAADEAQIRLPAWARGRVEPQAQLIVDGLRESGAAIIGRLELLLEPAADGPEGEPSAAIISPELSATLAMGVAYAAGMLHGSRPDALGRLDRTLELPYLRGRALASIPLARARRLGPLLLRYLSGRGAP